MKTYQAFAKTTETSQLINTEIKAKSIKEDRTWFENNTVENERVYLVK